MTIPFTLNAFDVFNPVDANSMPRDFPDIGQNQAWAIAVQRSIQAMSANNFQVISDTRANLLLNLTPTNQQTGVVYNDPNPDFDGIYVKSGASGAGTWIQLPTLEIGSGTGGTIDAATQLTGIIAVTNLPGRLRDNGGEVVTDWDNFTSSGWGSSPLNSAANTPEGTAANSNTSFHWVGRNIQFDANFTAQEIFNVTNDGAAFPDHYIRFLRFTGVSTAPAWTDWLRKDQLDLSNPATHHLSITGILQNTNLPDRLRESPSNTTDWNTVTQSGFYRSAPGATNSPEGAGASTLFYRGFCIAFSGTTHTLVVWDQSNNKYVRYLNGGVYTDWQQVDIPHVLTNRIIAGTDITTSYNSTTGQLTINSTAAIGGIPARLGAAGTAIADADLALDNGWYQLASNTPNAPDTGAWRLHVDAFNNTSLVQTATRTLGDGVEIQIRNRTASAFGPWERVDIRNVLANRIVAGTNITTSYDFVSGQLTINSTGGGGGTIPTRLSDFGQVVTDWNASSTLVNGWLRSSPGATNTPEGAGASTQAWFGRTDIFDVNSGVQWAHQAIGASNPGVWFRWFYFSGTTGQPTYVSWRRLDAAGDISFNPAGNIAATNVQSAIEELDSEKANSFGDAAITVGGGTSPVDFPQFRARRGSISGAGIVNFADEANIVRFQIAAPSAGSANGNMNFNRFSSAGAFQDTPFSVQSNGNITYANEMNKLRYGSVVGLAASTDLDGITGAGTYRVNSPVNGPWTSTGNFWLEVLHDTGLNSSQQRLMIVSTNRDAWWTRSNVGGTWGVWRPMGGWVTPEHYGANNQGTANASGALTEALNSGFPVLLAGQYRLDTLVSVTDVPVFIQGMGRHDHIISNSSSGRLQITFGTLNNFQNNMVVMKDIGFEARNAALANAVTINISGTSGSTVCTHHISNCTFFGSSDTNGFLRALDLNNCRNGLVQNCTAQGPRGGGNITANTQAFRCRGSANYIGNEFRDNNVYFWDNGLRIQDTGEGMTISGGEMVACNVTISANLDATFGVDGPGDAGKPLLKINNMHLNATQTAIELTDVRDFQIVNNDILRFGPTNNTWRGILIIHRTAASQYGWIDGNKFEDATANPNANIRRGIEIQGNATGVMNSRIGVNRFVSLNIGLSFDSNTRNVLYSAGNMFAAVTTNVSNAGTGNTTY